MNNNERLEEDPLYFENEAVMLAELFFNIVEFEHYLGGDFGEYEDGEGWKKVLNQSNISSEFTDLDNEGNRDNKEIITLFKKYIKVKLKKKINE